MNNNLIKKSILVISSAIVLFGVSVFAYWMSELNAPIKIKDNITVIIGVGDATSTNLKVKEAVDELGLTFVPATRIPEDIIDETYVSEFVFELDISWDYETEEIDEKGVLVIYLDKFIFYDQAPYEEEGNKSQVQLTEYQQECLKDVFEIELVEEVDGEFIKPEGNYLIVPNEKYNTQTVHVRLNFKEDVKCWDTWNLIKNKIFELKVNLEVEQTIIT